MHMVLEALVYGGLKMLKSDIIKLIKKINKIHYKNTKLTD